MPEFSSAFNGLKNGRMLTHVELVRAIRFMVAAEYEAIQLYQQLAESTDNTLAQQVLYDIANEEKVHAGEFLRLLKELDPEEDAFYREGALEVETEFLRGGAPVEGAAPAEEAEPAEETEPTAAETGGLGIGSLKP